MADAMLEILSEDECNDTYGRIRMYQALNLKQPENVKIPSERTVYRVMEEIGIKSSAKTTGEMGLRKQTGKPEKKRIS